MKYSFLLIAAAGRRYLMHIGEVQEIVAMMALTPVDDPGGACRGMANLRGRVLPVFDLSGPDARLTPGRSILVCHIGGAAHGLIADEVFDVIRLSPDELSVQPIGGGRSLQLARLGDEVVAVLEPARALARAG